MSEQSNVIRFPTERRHDAQVAEAQRTRLLAALAMEVCNLVLDSRNYTGEDRAVMDEAATAAMKDYEDLREQVRRDR